MGTGTPMAHGPLASVRLPEKSKMQRIFWSRAPGDPAQWGGGALLSGGFCSVGGSLSRASGKGDEASVHL